VDWTPSELIEARELIIKLKKAFHKYATHRPNCRVRQGASCSCGIWKAWDEFNAKQACGLCGRKQYEIKGSWNRFPYIFFCSKKCHVAWSKKQKRGSR